MATGAGIIMPELLHVFRERLPPPLLLMNGPSAGYLLIPFYPFGF